MYILSTKFYHYFLVLYTKKNSFNLILHTVQCTRNEDCPVIEACIGGMCQRPCDVRNPCAHNAVCVNTNHGSDCSCIEGYHGDGYVGCQPGLYIFVCEKYY